MSEAEAPSAACGMYPASPISCGRRRATRAERRVALYEIVLAMHAEWRQAPALACEQWIDAERDEDR